MNKQAKKALNQMDKGTKLEALRMLLDSMDESYIVMLGLGNGMYTGHHSAHMMLPEYCNMMAGFMVSVANKNNMTPIQLLSDIGETMSVIMNEEDKRTKADNS